VYRSSRQDLPIPAQSEMETSANVWEIDGTERPRASSIELESPVIGRVHMWEERRWNNREELHF
jgi:hypothetical protein